MIETWFGCGSVWTTGGCGSAGIRCVGACPAAWGRSALASGWVGGAAGFVRLTLSTAVAGMAGATVLGGLPGTRSPSMTCRPIETSRARPKRSRKAASLGGLPVRGSPSAGYPSASAVKRVGVVSWLCPLYMAGMFLPWMADLGTEPGKTDLGTELWFKTLSQSPLASIMGVEGYRASKTWVYFSCMTLCICEWQPCDTQADTFADGCTGGGCLGDGSCTKSCLGKLVYECIRIPAGSDQCHRSVDNRVLILCTFLCSQDYAPWYH